MAADLHKSGHHMSAVTPPGPGRASTTEQLSPLWLALSAAVFSAFVFLHWPITRFCEGVIARLGFAAYQWVAAALFLAVGLVTIATLSRRRQGAAALTWRYLLGLFALIALAQPTLVLVNIENVHFPQYALLAILLARAGFGPEGAWLGATALGLLDEAYQLLFMEAGRPDRLDWNDITFNALGAAVGVTVALHYGLTRARPARHSGLAIAAILAPLIILALVAAPPAFSPFYAVTPAGLRSRELTPGEGLILVGGLWISVNVLVRRLAHREAAPANLGYAVAGGLAANTARRR
jgi:hypothetical protein